MGPTIVIRGAIATAAAALALGATSARADFVPAPGSPYPTDNEPYSVNPGRFNADALTDLAVVHGTSSTVKVFDATAAGGFANGPGSPFAVGSGPNFAGVADYNGDGREDLAVANYLSSSVSIELQQANGTFALEGSTLGVTGKAGAIGTGDFNGDGKPDLAVGDWDHGTVVLYLRKGDNTGFVQGASLSTGGTNPRYLAVGDLDGTGAPDIAVTNSGSNTVAALLVGAGATLTAAPSSPYAVGTTPQFVVIGRLGDDARPDLAVANYGSNSVSVLDQQPSGAFVPGPAVGVGTHPVGLAAGDLSGTGRLDLVVANGGDGTFSLLANTGSGFSRGADVTVGGSPYGIAVGRFTGGDDDLDVAVTSLVSSPNTLSVFRNRPAPAVTTGEAADVMRTSARLQATVNPRGTSTGAFFEYGTSTAYGTRTPAGGEVPVGADRTEHAVTRSIDGLRANTTYHVRAVAVSAGGTTPGADRTFATPPDESTPDVPPPPPSASGGPPQASLLAPTTVAAGTPTTLSAEGSTPADGVSYRMDLDGSGAFATNLKTDRSVQTTFTAPGDVSVGLRVTDEQGRSDEVRRTVRVVAPAVYTLATSPTVPRAGKRVSFTVRQLADDPQTLGPAAPRPLPTGSLATMSYGDGQELYGRVGSVLRVTDRDASASGDFTHTFDKAGSYTVKVNVDDGRGFSQGVSTVVKVGRSGGYQPAIATATTTVSQGSCVTFSNATANQLSFDELGQLRTRDVNPAGRVINIKPGPITFGGGVNYRDLLVTPDQLVLGRTAIAGSPLGNLAGLPSALNLDLSTIAAAPRARPRQAVEAVVTNPEDTCKLQENLERAAAVYTPPVAKDPSWQAIPDCAGGLKLQTYSEDQKLLPDLVTQQLQTTRHTFFSLNKWDFGDGSRSGPASYLPSASVFHPYNKGGSFDVKLTTVSPADLKGQVKDYTAGCQSKPLNAEKPDDRFDTNTATLKLRVLRRYTVLRSRGLTMSTYPDFVETDLPDVYETSGPIYINTRRVGYGWNADRSLYTQANDVSQADGVLVVTPDDRPLRVVPERGEIIGAAQLAFQSGGERIALGPMPIKLGGIAGLVLPTATNGNQHDLGIFRDPPAKLAPGTLPAKGQPFHVNAAHVVLREGNGGLLELNVHMPQPLGPDGAGSDQDLVRDVRANGRAVVRGGAQLRALLDNVDVEIPSIDLAPGIVSFNGGRLKHDVKATPPWQATGSLSVLGVNVDLSPQAKKEGCPVVGGLGFTDSGGLYSAGAIVDGLTIPIPNPPAPPFAALASPALQILPATSTRPLDLFGCLTLQDYPSNKAFQVIGCAGMLLAGSGKTIPVTETIPFCPDQNGTEAFALTDTNSSPAGNGRRRLVGTVVRVSGTLALGPGHYRVANSYLEYRSSPFTIEAKAHIGEEFLGGSIKLTGDVFGNFRGIDDWSLGGEASITQDIICVPFTDICPSAGLSVLASSRGFGGCVTILAISVGGSVDFRDASVTPHVGDCGLDDLKRDLGITSRALPRAADLLAGPDPLRAMGAAANASVQLPAGAPYAMVVVNGTDVSPTVQLRGPDGKLVLDDTGAPLQGITQDTDPAKRPPQGIVHLDRAEGFNDASIDLRHATVLFVRAPKAGKYTITTKDGSAPITATSHTMAFPEPRAQGAVAGARGGKMLSLKSDLPAGTTMEVTEEGRGFSRKVTMVKAAQRVRRLRFAPMLGPAGKREVVGTVLRDGVPVDRIVLARFRAPGPPRAGRPGDVVGVRRGGAVRVSWGAATGATRYEVTVKARGSSPVLTSVPVKRRSLKLTSPLLRLGGKVTVRAIGPLEKAGPAARAVVPAVRVVRIKEFVL